MPKKADDPDRLIRESAGRYRTGDERFVVEQESPGAWYVADALHTDELGLPLLRGPFATLTEARSAIADARPSSPPARPVRAKPATDKPAAKRLAGRLPAPEPTPKPRTWLDELSSERRKEAERLIRDLGALAIDGAEALVRRELGSGSPVIALVLLRRALTDRLGGDAAFDAIVDVLTGEGFDKDRGRPPRGWRLVELDERGRQTGRDIGRPTKR